MTTECEHKTWRVVAGPFPRFNNKALAWLAWRCNGCNRLNKGTLSIGYPWSRYRARIQLNRLARRAGITIQY